MRILTYGTKRFPVPAMFLVQAQYIFSFAKNKGQGLIYLSRAEQRDPALDELFTCFFYRKQNEVCSWNSMGLEFLPPPCLSLSLFLSPVMCITFLIFFLMFFCLS